MECLLRFLMNNKNYLEKMDSFGTRIWRDTTDDIKTELIVFENIDEVFEYILDHLEEKVAEFWWMETRNGKGATYNMEIFEE